LSEPLQTANPYPHSRAFVLKLHRDADVVQGALRGRIEHVASGIRGEFSGTEQLLGWLASGLEHGCDDTMPPQARHPSKGAL
jgi:hypothetical protein